MNLNPKMTIDTHRYGDEQGLANRASVSFGHEGARGQGLRDLKDLQPR